MLKQLPTGFRNFSFKKNSQNGPFYAVINGKTYQVAVSDETSKYQVSWQMEHTDSSSQTFDVQIYDEDKYTDYKKVEKSLFKSPLSFLRLLRVAAMHHLQILCSHINTIMEVFRRKHWSHRRASSCYWLLQLFTMRFILNNNWQSAIDWKMSKRIFGFSFLSYYVNICWDFNCLIIIKLSIFC